MDEEGAVVSRSMGKALNVSPKGILLETAHELRPGLISLMSVDLENHLIEINGKVIYSQKTETKKFESGIVFRGTEDENRAFGQKLILVFHYRKNGHISQKV